MDLQYYCDSEASGIPSEIKSFKHSVLVLFLQFSSADSLGLFYFIHEHNLAECYSDLANALRIVLCLAVTVFFYERCCVKVKIMKNCLRACMTEEGLTNMSILST